MSRPRTPTAILEQRGAFSVHPERRKEREGEPAAPQGEVVKPSYVKGRAAKIWARYAPVCIELGTLTIADERAFAAWCCLAAEHEKACDDMPASRIAQMRAYENVFGLNQSARAKLHTAKPEDDDDDRFFGGAQVGHA